MLCVRCDLQIICQLRVGSLQSHCCRRRRLCRNRLGPFLLDAAARATASLLASVMNELSKQQQQQQQQQQQPEGDRTSSALSKKTEGKLVLKPLK